MSFCRFRILLGHKNCRRRPKETLISTKNEDRVCHRTSAKKRQRAAELQDLSEVACSQNRARRLGVRLPSAARAFYPSFGRIMPLLSRLGFSVRRLLHFEAALAFGLSVFFFFP